MYDSDEETKLDKHPCDVVVVVIFVCLIKDPCLIPTPQCAWTSTQYTMSSKRRRMTSQVG